MIETMDRFAGTGISSFWTQADSVSRATALLLLLMSIVTWYLILTKTTQVWRLRRQADRVPDAFWAASTLEQAAAKAHGIAPDGPFARIAAEALAAERTPSAHSPVPLNESLGRAEQIRRILRRALQRTSRRLDSGLSVLASVGATAPFVGLFGTVWGIYHALTDIGLSGQVSIDKVAGPVGEALIMTALGIAVAVPAVLGYNFLLRANRVIAQELDGFAHDLHAYLIRDLPIPDDDVKPGVDDKRVGQGGG